MKLEEICNILAKTMGTSNVDELNKILKDKKTEAVKYRMASPSLGHFGFTGHIKNITTEGLKVYDMNKVTLIRFEDIDVFEQAKPRAERPVGSKKPEKKTIEPKKTSHSDDDELRPKKLKKKAPSTNGKQGSKFIPRG
jgi:hypothetical protein